MPFSDDGRKARTSSTLVVIGIFKLLKSGLLLSLGIGLVYWRDRDLGQVASDWINAVWVGRSFCDSLLAKLSSLSPRTIEEVAVGSFIYSGMLLVEGIGLCRRKRWAEFLTVAITASLLPFEFHKIFCAPTATAVVITLVNIAILLYLVIQLISDRRHQSFPQAR